MAGAASTSSSWPGSMFGRRSGCRSTRRARRAAPTCPARRSRCCSNARRRTSRIAPATMSGVPQARSPLDAVDPERGIARRVTLPERRTFELSGWASVGPGAPDDALDRLAGDRAAAAARMRSSSRFEGMPSNRASSAFDGDPASAWVGDRLPGKRPPWIEWQTPRLVRLTSCGSCRARRSTPRRPACRCRRPRSAAVRAAARGARRARGGHGPGPPGRHRRAEHCAARALSSG